MTCLSAGRHVKYGGDSWSERRMRLFARAAHNSSFPITPACPADQGPVILICGKADLEPSHRAYERPPKGPARATETSYTRSGNANSSALRFVS